MWMVQCEVWGGVTGHRVGMLKENGVDCEFATREEAQKVAEQHAKAVGMLRAAGMVIKTGAQFSYVPVEV